MLQQMVLVGNKFFNFLHFYFKNFLFLYFLVTSCGNDLDKINNTQVVIKYDSFNFNKIEEDDFFLIDNIKFIHKKYHTNDISENSYILPTPNFIIKKVEGKKNNSYIVSEGFKIFNQGEKIFFKGKTKLILANE